MDTISWGAIKPPQGWKIDAQNPLTDRLLHYYTFNEGGGTSAYDYSGRGKRAAISSGLAAFGVGSQGGGRAFSPTGTNYFSVSTTVGVNTPGDAPDFTMACRFKVSSVAAGTIGIMSVAGTAAGDQTTASPSYLLQRNAAQLRVLVGNTSYTNLITTMAANQWYTVVSVYRTGLGETHFINGPPAITAAPGWGTGSTFTGSLYIGSGFNTALSGSIEFLAVWSRALTNNEAIDFCGAPYDLFYPRMSPLYSIQEVISTLDYIPCGFGGGTDVPDYYAF